MVEIGNYKFIKKMRNKISEEINKEGIKLASKIWKIRLKKGISMTKFCKIANLSFYTLFRLERNCCRTRLSTLVKVARVLKIPLWKLVNTD